MTQKSIYVGAILAVLFTSVLAMASQNAKADGTGVCPCGNGKGFWTCANCDSFTEQPQVQQTAKECHYYNDGSVYCHWEPFFGYHQPTTGQPHTQQVFFRPDNCFWSYPVQC